MTKAYEDYHNTFMAETAALIELFGGLLQGSRSADEINQQADQYFANLKDAASQYWEERNPEKFDKELTAPTAPQVICHAAAEGANLESLPCAGDDLPFEDNSRCDGCGYSENFENEKVHVNVALPELMLQEIRKLRAWWVDLIGIEDEYLAAPLPDDQLLLVALDEWTTFKWEELGLQDEIKKAHENGGRTEYLFTENGEEYYTTTDGVRHYTRVEG